MAIRTDVVMVQKPDYLTLSIGYDEAVVLMTALKWHHTAISRYFNDAMKQTVEETLREVGSSLDQALGEFRLKEERVGGTRLPWPDEMKLSADQEVR